MVCLNYTIKTGLAINQMVNLSKYQSFVEGIFVGDRLAITRFVSYNFKQ